MPLVSRVAAELKGNYRFRLAREKSFLSYWSRMFLRFSVSGAACVTLGYIISCIIIYCVFPWNSHFLPHSAYPEDSIEEITLGRQQLSSTLNSLFKSDSEFIYILNYIIVVFVYATLISALCLMIYLVFKNKYKALGLPMIAFFLLDQSIDSLRKNGISKAMIFSPKYLIFSMEPSLEQWGIKALWYYIIMVILLAVLYLLGGLILRKRVMN